jgi:DNA-binding LacI/PurR family transcriptional regulator
VQEIIADMGYQPSALARSLIQQRSATLGVVTAGLNYIGPSRTLNGITSQAEELGYSLLLKELPGFDVGDVDPLLNSLLSRQVDGILWAVPEVGDNRRCLEERLPDLPVPIVFLTQRQRPGIPVVTVDNYAGGIMAVQHLLSRGYRKVGHISGPLEWWDAAQRKAGWREALSRAGQAAPDQHCIEGTWSTSSGYRAMQQLCVDFPDIDAVFVANDQMALGAMYYAAQQGLRVPQDLAFVGFDSIPESAYFSPSLTTINPHQNQMGSEAVHQLVRLIHNEEPEVIVLDPELIVRDSSEPRETLM